MPSQRLRAAGFRGLFLGCALLACGCGEEAPPADAPVEITPDMEKMKDEMMKNYKNKSFGATKPAATPKKP